MTRKQAFGFPPSPLLIGAVAALLVASTTGCKDDEAQKTTAIGDVLSAVGARGEALNDFRLDGELVTTNGGEATQAVHFKYYQRQPKLLRLDVVEDKTHMTFDGQTLAIIKDDQKTAVKQSFAGQDPATQIITLHNAFGAFACEGWRPPTLSPKSATATLSKDDNLGPIWTIVQPLQDATLKEVRYILRAPKADFVSKETLNKAGDVVAYTRMLEEHKDSATNMTFPKKWTVKDAAKEYTVTLETIAINQGIDKGKFSVTPPEGYNVHNVGAGNRQ